MRSDGRVRSIGNTENESARASEPPSQTERWRREKGVRGLCIYICSAGRRARESLCSHVSELMTGCCCCCCCCCCSVALCERGRTEEREKDRLVWEGEEKQRRKERQGSDGSVVFTNATRCLFLVSLRWFAGFSGRWDARSIMAGADASARALRYSRA